MPLSRKLVCHFSPAGGGLAAQDRAHDGHVLAHLGHRLVDRLAVPALDDRAVRDAEAEAQAPAGQLVRAWPPSCAIVAGVRV